LEAPRLIRFGLPARFRRRRLPGDPAAGRMLFEPARRIKER